MTSPRNMAPSVTEQLAHVPLRNAKCAGKRGEAVLQKLNSDAGDVLDLARENARLEAKQMADTLGISHSLCLRGLKGVDHISFHRLWELSDEFWAELLIAVAKKRRIAIVRTTIEIPHQRSIA